jgi:multisubunit Na+/H+ antiporter MnhF subunit
MAIGRITVRRLVAISAVGTLVALALMVIATLWPAPFPLVLAMSLGQFIGTASLALYLLAIAMDLQMGTEERERDDQVTRLR